MSTEELKAAIESSLIAIAMEKAPELRDVSLELVDVVCDNMNRELDKLLEKLTDENYLKRQTTKLSRWTRRQISKLRKIF